MPQTAPPPAMPAPVPAPQQQQQQQVPYSTQAADLFNGNSSKSDSESTGVISQEGMMSNTQVNIMHNTHIGYGSGNTHPVPVFTGTMRYNPNYGDFEAIVGISIPLGGKSTRISRERLQASRDKIIIENRFRELSGCSNIMKAGYSINYAMLEANDPLWKCQAIFASAEIELPPVSSLTDEYRLELQKSQVLIQKLLKRIEQLEHENGKGNPFTPPG